MTINGTTTSETFTTLSAPTVSPNLPRMIAHCAAKQTSAMVATERPTRTLDSQVSNKHIR
jgi:hypothetical protein